MKSNNQRYVRSVFTPEAVIPICSRALVFKTLDPTWIFDFPNRHFARIMCVKSGSCRVVCDADISVVSAGHMMVWLPGSKQVIQGMQSDSEVIWWTMDGNLLSEILGRIGLDESGIYKCTIPEIELKELSLVIADSTLNGQLRNSAVSYNILTRLIQTDSELEPVIERAIHYIESNLHRYDLSVENVAAGLNMERSTFSKRFSREMHCSPVVYITQRRVEVGMHLLTTTDFTVAEIAGQTGYTQASYFARVFRRVTGLSPTEIRKREL